MSLSSNVLKRMEEGSWIRRMFEEGASLKRQYGADRVFDLSLGNPVTEPPPEFHRELRQLAQDAPVGLHRYMENAGYPETRQAVAAQLAKETGLGFEKDDVVMTCGASGGLNVVLKAVLDPGEEIMVFAPYFVEYDNYVDNHGGLCRVLPTDEQFVPRLDLLEPAITNRTKGVIINSPNNPSGVVYSVALLHRLGDVLKRKESELGTQIFLISDEPYRKILYDGLEFPSIFAHHRHSIAVTSHSKDLALAGERIGYIAVHPDCDVKADLMAALIFCNRALGFVNAPALMQYVIRSLQDVTVSVADYQRKRDFLYQNLCAMGYSVVKPQGAFYMFPRSPSEDEIEFVKELQSWRVLTVPGKGFGSPGHFRIAYCVHDSTLEGSLEGFRRAAQKYHLC
ncbi:MAG: pyridoxal phosphate-dependent aminotransferase [Chloroflexota bacterium]